MLRGDRAVVVDRGPRAMNEFTENASPGHKPQIPIDQIHLAILLGIPRFMLHKQSPNESFISFFYPFHSLTRGF